MTVRLVVICERPFPGDRRPCGQTYATTAADETDARLQALAAGWAADPQRGDLCPAHAPRKDTR